MPQAVANSVSERAYSEIKGMIARRELGPGAPLILQSLAEHLGMSRTPVVEAIRRLERDGLVTVAPKWGATVKEWSQEEIYEAYCIRRALEGEAARHFIQRATAQDREKLVQLSRRFDEYALSDTMKCDETDIELHLHIIRSTRFPRLYELIENSKIETAIITALSFAAIHPSQREEKYRSTVGCHNRLVEALLGADPQEATFAIWEHIDTHLELIEQLGVTIEKSDPRTALK